MKRFYCILFLSYNLLSADDFQAQVQPASFSLQQSAYLTVSTAQSLSQVEFDLPQSQQFQLRYESQSSQTRYINGAMERSTTWFFRILASGPGTFNIPQFQCHSQGKTYTIPATSFTVLSETPKAGTESTEDARLLLTGDFPQKWYVGQCCPLQVQLLTSPRLRGQLSSFPQKKGDAFSATHLVDTPQKATQTVQGTTFACLYWPTLVSALQSGENVLSLSIDMEIEQKARVRRLFDDDPLDILSQGFGGIFSRSEPVTLQSKIYHITVLPLPTPQPANFLQAIGFFQVSTPQPLEKEFIQNEPLTLSVKITGRGNFENIKAPTLDLDPNIWRTYDPSSSFEAKDSIGYSGELTFKYTLVPLKDGSIDLPTVNFCFFNTTTDRSENVSRKAPAPITVKPALHTSVSTPIATDPGQKPEEIKVKVNEPHYSVTLDPIEWESQHSSFWIWQILLGCFTLAFAIVAGRYCKINHDPAYAKKLQREKQISHLSKVLNTAFKRRQAVEVYTTLHDLLSLLLERKDNARESLSPEQRNLVDEIERHYQEVQFGQKQCACPQNFSQIRKLLKDLK